MKLKSRGCPWEQGEIDEMIRLWNAGWKPAYIGSQIGRSTDAVRDKAGLCGLHRTKGLIAPDGMPAFARHDDYVALLMSHGGFTGNIESRAQSVSPDYFSRRAVA